MVSKRGADRFAKQTRMARRGFNAGVVTAEELDQFVKINFHFQTSRFLTLFEPTKEKIVIVSGRRK